MKPRETNAAQPEPSVVMAPPRGWAEFRQDSLLCALAFAYGVIWFVTAIAPFDRRDWMIENILVVAAIPAVVAIFRHRLISQGSWVLLFLFFTLHAIGAHYTYSEMPVGNWLRDELGWARNHYDRVVHFSFGLLLAGPLRELLAGVGVRGRYLPSIVALHVLMGWSGLYEVMEGLVAMVVSPELGAAFNGTQGDIWDAQKDMSLAVVGACIALGLGLARPGNGAPPETPHPDRPAPRAGREPRHERSGS